MAGIDIPVFQCFHEELEGIEKIFAVSDADRLQSFPFGHGCIRISKYLVGIQHVPKEFFKDIYHRIGKDKTIFFRDVFFVHEESCYFPTHLLSVLVELHL